MFLISLILVDTFHRSMDFFFPLPSRISYRKGKIDWSEVMFLKYKQPSSHTDPNLENVRVGGMTQFEALPRALTILDFIPNLSLLELSAKKKLSRK